MSDETLYDDVDVFDLEFLRDRDRAYDHDALPPQHRNAIEEWLAGVDDSTAADFEDALAAATEAAITRAVRRLAPHVVVVDAACVVDQTRRMMNLRPGSQFDDQEMALYRAVYEDNQPIVRAARLPDGSWKVK